MIWIILFIIFWLAGWYFSCRGMIMLYPQEIVFSDYVWMVVTLVCVPVILLTVVLVYGDNNHSVREIFFMKPKTRQRHSNLERFVRFIFRVKA